jgi:hypothetical protein
MGMASVYRQDTGEFLGYLTDLYGPLRRGTKEWSFKTWQHSDGKLRDVPEGPVARFGRLTAPPFSTVQIPVANIENPDVHLIVPPDLLDFIVSHQGFRAPVSPSH